MTIWRLMLLVGALGAAGGVINCAGAQEFSLPGKDTVANVWRPGWIGTVLVGAAAAVVIWGIYGALAAFDIVNGELKDFHLTLGQLLSSPVVGFSGGRFLKIAAEKEAERISKATLADVLSKISQSGGL